jgi:hypothetical protein
VINRILLLLFAIGVLGCSTTAPWTGTSDTDIEQRFDFQWASSPVDRFEPEDFANVRNLLESEQPILALYREDLTHQAVVDFFVRLTGSPETALPILYHAEQAGISLSLVFALAWVESRYSPIAVNQNATSTDRGLFQLNSRTFTELTEDDFFHPDINTYHGISYLEWCLEHTDSEMQAVAVYNAGLTRVRAGRTPASTLIYVDRISRFRATLEREFRAYILNEFPSHNT